MEATGVYWMALYEVLEEHDLSVTLINPRHFKNVQAHKTDVKDCQWLHQLHAHGLLRASHIARKSIVNLRAIYTSAMSCNSKKVIHLIEYIVYSLK
jgi:transposase